MAPIEGNAVMTLTLASGATLEEASDAVLEKYSLTLVESKKETINGMPAVTMVAEQKQEATTTRVLSSLIQFEGNIFSLMGVSDLSKFASYEPVFLNTIRNFKELRDSEKLNRKPDSIKIKTIPQQMTLQEAFQNFGMPSDRFEELALLNGMQLTDQLSKGMLIKVVGK
jgi:predicted Zn-dependent protease